MKKSLLSLALVVSALSCFSQTVIFEVLTPEEVAGTYSVEYPLVGADGWPLVPDLTLPENSVTGDLAIGRDGTAADSLGCEPLINPEEVDGKITLIWRGTCDFAVKAGHAYDAGAIAVMIVNNLPGTGPVVPGGGTTGAANNVDVPVAMTTYEAGLALIPHVNAGTASAFLGAVVFENDLSILPWMVLRPDAATKPLAIAQNADEFSVPLGSFLMNNGTATQTGVSLQATVTYNGTELYSEIEEGLTIESGDTIFVALPTFSQDEYSMGRYEITYTTDSDQEEELPVDNVPVDASVTFTENLFSYSPYDPETESVPGIAYQRQADFNDVFMHCIHFRDPNASRLRLEGMEFSVASDAGTSLAGTLVDLIAYTWEDEFETIDEAEIENLIDFDYAFYDFLEDQQEEQIYQEFDNQVILEDNVRYLFCISTTSEIMRYGYGPTTADYTATINETGQPTFPIFTTTIDNEPAIGTTFYFPGFGLDMPPAFAARLVDITVGVNDVEKVEITPYPNPTMDYIGIPYSGTAASATMMIYDNAGKLVKSANVNFEGSNMIRVDMAGVPNGNYVFNMQFNDGTTSNFKVVVAR